MTTQTEWEEFFVKYHRINPRQEDYKIAASEFHSHLTNPSSEDIGWLTEAFHDKEKKWFISRFIFLADQPISEKLFQPMMEGGIAQVDPSNNRYFIEPCMKNFGPRMVNEYLLDVVEFGDPFRQAGAVNALYWANILLEYSGGGSWNYESATPESRSAYEALNDIWDRKMILFLELFVKSDDLDILRSIIPSLDLFEEEYPESYREMVREAIIKAEYHSDEYIRHRSGVQLGTESTLKALPHRESENNHDD